MVPDDPQLIREAYLQDLRGFDFDEADLEEQAPDLSVQFTRMLLEPELRLTHEFCEANAFRARWNPSRHPCGEVKASWESWDDYHERYAKESDWFHRIERSLCDPHSDRFWEVWCSSESLETKKAAVRKWIAVLSHHSQPVIYPVPRLANGRTSFSFFGRHWSDMVAACHIRVTSEWRGYQKELADARENRRGDRPDHTALAWLKRNAVKALKTRVTSEMKAKAQLRLEVMGWNWSEFKRQAKERGWI